MRYTFANFELDTATLELAEGGAVVSVEPQVFEMLVYLIENRDRVISKDELIEAVWDGRIVSDAAISSRIKLVRRAVGDDGTRQAIIKTVHGKGFRFIADVSADSAAARRANAPAAAPPPDTKPLPLPWVWIGVAAAAALAIILISTLLARTDASPGARIAVLPVANETGDASLDWAEIGLMSLAARDLQDQSQRTPVSAQAVLGLSNRLNTGSAGPLDPTPRLQDALREAYGASHIVAAQLTGEVGALSLDYRVFNPRGASPVRSLAGENPVELVAEMSREVAVGLPRSGERQLAYDDQSFDDPYVAETYARGRHLQMLGRGEESANLFRVAAEQAPNNIWLRYELALSTRIAGDLEAAEAQLETLLAEATDSNNLRAEAAIHNGLGRIHARRGDTALAIGAYEQALAANERAGDHEVQGVILSNLGIEHRRLGEYAKSEDYLGRARIAYEAAGYAAAPGSLLNSFALLKIETRDLAAARDYLDAARQSFELVGDTRAVAAVLRNLGDIQMRRGDLEGAEQSLAESLAIRRELEDTRGELSSLYGLSGLYLTRGDTSAAGDSIAQFNALAGEAAGARGEADAQVLQARLLALQGDFSAALQASSAAEAAFTTLDRERNARREQVRQSLIRAHGEARFDPAPVAAVQDWAAAEGHDSLRLAALDALTEIALLSGDTDAARAQASEALAQATELRLPAAIGRLAARQGLVRLSTDEDEVAAAALGRAREAAPDHPETLLLDALLAARRDDRARAAQAHTAAKAAAGANWLALQRLYPGLIAALPAD